MPFAAASEAVGGVGVGVDLHGSFAVLVEGAFHRVSFSGFQAVVGQDGSDGEGGFDGGNGHIWLFSVLFSNEEKIEPVTIRHKHTL